MRFRVVCLVLVIVSCTHVGAAEDNIERADVEMALKRAVTFFREHVATHGAYLWRYSADLKYGEGEASALRTTAWVQPPGTPTVGEAYLFAYHLTQDLNYRNAAVETAHGLCQGQLESGGWDYRIEFGQQRARYRYRLDAEKSSARNVTTLDDDVTQSALRFLMRVDLALGFQDKQIHEASLYALQRLEEAQYPNGAWPQRFAEPPAPEQFPVLPAAYPETWPREYPKIDYRSFYTFNDNTIADMIETMFMAAAVYNEPSYQACGEKAGSFILLAQMPEPQPAWSQQYNARMEPAWARRFEPAAITGGESQGVMRTLLKLYEWTGDKKYLEPIPRALAYLRKSQLPDGRLARFYELKSNKPLYFTTKYELTYDDGDLPTHYGFQVGSSLDAIEAAYQRIKNAPPRPLKVRPTRSVKLTSSLARQARQVVDALDPRGAWLEKGQMRTVEENVTTVIETRTFAKNVGILARFIAAQP